LDGSEGGGVGVLLFLVVDGVCRLLEEGGLLRGMKVTDHYVEKVYESSTREKKISNLPKIRWKIQYLFFIDPPVHVERISIMRKCV